ncbi:DEAD/DEAH box helicase [Flavobacteriaceae bacterium]|jgi:superfamily II DNA/RNA helicase|nr:DEAD/DEAH box helicase [Flavobacteriaceae bacterium]MDB4108349.1 DEAD/DEAH box helicase [Flavobacteriaceae bacterium]MDB4182796.1 DEAD/DEAH box helicase [Flavobacteriaceae bacterium]MDC0092535.1 DEAD/DEAH box helicase [bacterium]MDG1394358.1 DEAD/DEAH box helicase [Flavobacteriaceae bacterium]
MPFKKLHSDIREKLASLEIITPTPFQVRSIPVIKSGSNVYCIAPKESGKTTTLILTTLQKLKCEADGNAPRAVVLVENKERALELYEAFLSYTKHNSLRVYVGYEELHIDIQKSEIFEGVDILITTPKTLNKLFLLNGVGTSKLKIFSIDDAEFLIQNSAYTALMSITQSIQKCQFVLYSEKMHPVLKRFQSYFMEYSKIIAS